MRPNFRMVFGIVLAQTIFLVSACTVIVPPQQGPVFRGPPPHAPAHGHRRHRHTPPPHAAAHGYRHHVGEGLVLVFDAKLAVYQVDGRPDYYYDQGHYFRRKEGRWQMCRDIEGPWIAASKSHVPPKLVVKYQKKAHHKKDKKRQE